MRHSFIGEPSDHGERGPFGRANTHPRRRAMLLSATALVSAALLIAASHSALADLKVIGNQTLIGTGEGGDGTEGTLGTSPLDPGLVFVGTSSGAGGLTISAGGSLSSSNSYLGYSADSTGTVMVTGAGSTWTNRTNLTVGYIGAGELTVSDGGSVSSFNSYVGGVLGSTGTVMVTGAGSTWRNTLKLTVGDIGAGELTVSQGGSVSNVDGYLGADSGATGIATVTGAGSTWTNSGSLRVGSYGTGTLTVSEGGAVTSANAYLGQGSAGTGTLTVSEGGAVTSANAYLGHGSAGVGTATITGAGSTWTNDALAVGWFGTGTLSIADGGTISTDDSAFVGMQGGSKGAATVTGTGSSWTTGGFLGVGYSSFSDGALTVSAGGAVTTATGYIGFNHDSTGAVVVTGANSRFTSTTGLGIGNGGAGVLTIADGGTVNVGGGSGTVTITEQSDATGTINIGAAAGDTAVAAGTLNAGTLAFGIGTAKLVFNHTDTDYVFNVDLTGSGALEHYSGTTSLTGDLAGFTGPIAALGGTLSLNTTYGGAVTIGDGGRLAGNGTIGGITANSGGTVAPGNSIGTLTVAGNASFAAGSTYEVEIDSAGNSDRIAATGAAAINGGTVSVIPYPGYAVATPYTILTATGGVTGTFDAVTFASLFLTPSLTYTANDIQMTIAQSSFASVAATPNQAATAAGLDSVGNGGVFDAVLALGTNAEAQAAYDALSGEIHGSARGLLLQQSRIGRDVIGARIRAAFGGPGPGDRPLIAFHGKGDAPAMGAVAWGQAYGGWGRTGGNAAGLDHAGSGFLLGMDADVFGGWRAGVLAGYGKNHFNVDARGSSGDADSYHAGVYAGRQAGPLGLRLGATYAWHDVATSRQVIVGAFSDSLSARYSAATAQIFGEAGYTLDTRFARLEPFAGLALVNQHMDGFTETGGAAALTGRVSNDTTGVTTLGLRGETGLGTFNGFTTSLTGSLAWRHAFGDVAPSSTLRFASGSDAFAISGTPIDVDTALVEAGLAFGFTNGMDLSFGYSGEFGKGLQDHKVSAHLAASF
ncbi:outer membrane autotransporter protein [Hoeflea marina]|uniref:Outer membrane autotransporter protein n=1 Tax=Hoeflea marina TaxID=274592 RepID=A0A317PG72_9HYPH|nr:autotransporter domain-containing protein [Hoeflea marina]PWV99045.1 outer membrane autotransporter protein [Hoeflea marina]